MVLCSSGTPGEDKSMFVHCCPCAAMSLAEQVTPGLLQGREGGGRNGDGP